MVDTRSSLLASAGRSAEIPESADVYGWLVGSWELDIRLYGGIDVSGRGLKAIIAMPDQSTGLPYTAPDVETRLTEWRTLSESWVKQVTQTRVS